MVFFLVVLASPEVYFLFLGVQWGVHFCSPCTFFVTFYSKNSIPRCISSPVVGSSFVIFFERERGGRRCSPLTSSVCTKHYMILHFTFNCTFLSFLGQVYHDNGQANNYCVTPSESHTDYHCIFSLPDVYAPLTFHITDRRLRIVPVVILQPPTNNNNNNNRLRSEPNTTKHLCTYYITFAGRPSVVLVSVMLTRLCSTCTVLVLLVSPLARSAGCCS